MRRVVVPLGDRAYTIAIGERLFERRDLLGPLVGARQVAIVTNTTVGPLYAAPLRETLARDAAQVIEVALPDGEAHKHWQTLNLIFDALLAHRFDRGSIIVALGGGVVGDMAGFAAAVYQRGIDFIQVPTTLLAQVDSSVGGKTGINHPMGKNMVGAFHQPRLVLADVGCLQTLADRELSAGLAEVIKHGAIADEPYLAAVERDLPRLLARDPGALADAVARSCEIKAEVVGKDEREAGLRAILNFGHTFGHAIERCQGYGEWLHGEAVAAGMVMAAQLSAVDNALAERIGNLLERAGLPTRPPAIAGTDLLAAMGMDKKVQQKRLRFVQLRSLGEAFVSSDYDAARLDAVLAGEA
jgi:3-dehydroquinate synthase